MHICRKVVCGRGGNFIRVYHFSTFEAKPQVGENLINGQLHEKELCVMDLWVFGLLLSLSPSTLYYSLSSFLRQGWFCIDFSEQLSPYANLQKGGV